MTNGYWDGRFSMTAMTSSRGGCNASELRRLLSWVHNGGAQASQAKQHIRVEENMRPHVKMAKCGDGRWYIGEGSPRWGHPTKGLT